MCDLLILPDGTYCERVGELRKALYPKTITPFPDLPFALTEDDCMCCIDFKALADREGWILARDPDDPIAMRASLPRHTP